MRFGSFPEWLAEVRAVREFHLDLTPDMERAQQIPRTEGCGRPLVGVGRVPLPPASVNHLSCEWNQFLPPNTMDAIPLV